MVTSIPTPQSVNGTAPTLPGDEFQRLFASFLLTRPDFAIAFMTNTRPEYFASPAVQWLIQHGKEFWQEYQTLPDRECFGLVAEQELTQIDDDADDEEVPNAQRAQLLESLELFDKLIAMQASPADVARIGYVRDHAAAWLRQQVVLEAAMQTQRDVANGRLDIDYTDRFRQALLVGESHISDGRHLVFGEYQNYIQYLRTEQPAPTGSGLAEADAIMGGGVRPGELAVFLAGTGKGKSQWLVFTGRNAALAGRKVLHVTLEMGREQTWRRYIASITETNSAEVGMKLKHVEEKLAALIPEIPGDIWIHHWPQNALTAVRLRAFLQQLRHYHHYEPDLLIIDYVDKMHTGLPVNAGSKATWEAQGILYGQIRQLAVEENLPIWTATQTNKSGQYAQEVSLTEVGDSYAKTREADVIISFAGDRSADRTHNFVLEAIKVRNDASGGMVRLHMDPALSLFWVTRLEDEARPDRQGIATNPDIGEEDPAPEAIDPSKDRLRTKIKYPKFKRGEF